MKITTNQTFRHDKTTYESDTEYDVSDELGHYFVNVGWAAGGEGAAEPEEQPGEVTLDVADVTSDQAPEGM
jgi:hypothetical protein